MIGELPSTVIRQYGTLAKQTIFSTVNIKVNQLLQLSNRTRLCGPCIAGIACD